MSFVQTFKLPKIRDFEASLTLGSGSANDNLIKDSDIYGKGLFTFQLFGREHSSLEFCWVSTQLL
jgi:hypothetical protein